MTYRDWVWTNRRKFIEGDYTIRQMIELSLAIGDWDIEEIKKTLRNWPRALWTRLDPDESANNIAKEKSQHFEETVLRMRGSSLQDQWHDYLDYARGIDWL